MIPKLIRGKTLLSLCLNLSLKELLLSKPEMVSFQTMPVILENIV